MIGPFDIEPRKGGRISASDLAELQRLAWVFANVTACPPLAVDVAPNGIHFRLDTDLSSLGTPTFTSATFTSGTITFTTSTVTSTGTTWTMTGDTWTWDSTSYVYLPTGSHTYIGTVPLAPCTLLWCPVLLYTDESISPAYTRSGNVLTAVSNAAMPNIDGVAPSVNDRILIDDDNDQTNCGIYTVTSLGSAGTPYVMTRATDANASLMFWGGRMVVVTKGTTYADTLWELETPDDGTAIVLNTTALSFKLMTTAATTNILLYGANHTDTLNGAVVRGDIIVGNSTPKWARKAKGTTGQIIYSDGTDVLWGNLTNVAGVLPIANGGAGVGTGSNFSMLHSGTTNMEAWYVAGLAQNVATPGAFTAAANKAYAMFEKRLRSGTIDRIAINCGVIAGTKKARVGVYSPLGSGSMYPGAYISGSDEKTLATGVNTFLFSGANPSISINAPYGVWFVLLCDTAPAMDGVSAITQEPGPVAWPSTLQASAGRGCFITADQTYGALSGMDPFSTTTIVLGGAGPSISFRLSA